MRQPDVDVLASLTELHIFTNLCINSRRLASGCGQCFGNHATGPILPWVMYLCKMTKGDTVHTFVTICKGRQNSAKFKHDASPAWTSSWKDLVLILCEHRDWTFNKKRHSYQLASDWKHSLCKHHLHHLFVTSRKTVPCMYPSEYWIGTLPDCHEQTNYWKDIPVLCPFPWSLRMDPMWFATKEHTPAQRRGGPVGVSGKGKGAKGLYFAYKNCMSQSINYQIIEWSRQFSASMLEICSSKHEKHDSNVTQSIKIYKQ